MASTFPVRLSLFLRHLNAQLSAKLELGYNKLAAAIPQFLRAEMTVDILSLIHAIRRVQAQIFGTTFSGGFSVKLPKN
jgi:hypothetical protein